MDGGREGERGGERERGNGKGEGQMSHLAPEQVLDALYVSPIHCQVKGSVAPSNKNKQH